MWVLYFSTGSFSPPLIFDHSISIVTSAQNRSGDGSIMTTPITSLQGDDLLLLCKTHRFSVIGKRTDRPTLPPLTAVVEHDQQRRNPPQRDAGISTSTRPSKIHVFLDINEPYTRQMIVKAFQDRAEHFDITLGPGFGNDEVIMPSTCHFQWSEYERIDWKSVLAGRHGASSYCVRKGLSRKAQLAFYTGRYIGKQKQMKNDDNDNQFHILRNAMPKTIIIDTWPVWEGEDTGDDKDPSFQGDRQQLANMLIHGTSHGSSPHEIRQRLEQCLAEAKQVMTEAEQAYDDSAMATRTSPPVWILKPSTVNKGAGIQIVHLYEQLLDICWEETDIREWVLQQYISSPLLLHGRKFHIRAYALAVSAIQVYLCQDCLALCSGTKYNEYDTSNYLAHITNTAYQERDANFDEATYVRLWKDDDVGPLLIQDGTCRNLHHARQQIQHVLSSMERITAQVFRAFQNEFSVFAPIEGCFEHYGLDFMVDRNWQVYLLEINPGPDFKQTGHRLSPIIQGLMRDTMDVALLLAGNVGDGESSKAPDRVGSLQLVYEHQVRSRGATSSSKDSGINMRLM